MLAFILLSFYGVSVIESQALILYNKINYKNHSYPRLTYVGSYD